MKQSVKRRKLSDLLLVLCVFPTRSRLKPYLLVIQVNRAFALLNIVKHLFT